ncbi:MAG: glycosyltransferase [PVC group bacterium]
MGSNTILILYVTVGQGHRRAALAIRDALEEKKTSLRVVCLDLMDLWSPVWGRLIAGLYRALVLVLPGLWAHLYDNQKVKERLARPLDLLLRFPRKRVCLLLKELTPAAVVCTQALPCALAARCKSLSRMPFSLIAVPTDFRVHAYWIYDEVDLYLLPSRESAVQLAGRGVLPGLIRVSGIPVHPGFNRKLDPAAMKRKHGLSPGLPAVLLMGGGEGSVSLERLVRALDRSGETFQTAALAGRNLRQHARLQRLRDRLRHPLTVFGFIDRVDELMAAVDVIVTKPGGLTTAEALVRRLPLVLIDPLPGQEDFNARFLRERGAAIHVPNAAEAERAVSRLLRDGDLRRRMLAAMAGVRKPDAARAAARYIIDSIPKQPVARIIHENEKFS